MKVDRLSSCEYYYGCINGRLWWDKPYGEALLIKRALADKVVGELLKEPPLIRDAERINRCLKVIKDLDKMLGDKPE